MADAGADCIVGGRIWQPAITSPLFRPSLVLLSKSGFTASWLPFFSALTGTLAWDKCRLETWHSGCPCTMLRGSRTVCVCVYVSVCIHVCLCVQPVMNLNYVLVWPAGPGYTSRVGDHAQWRNQGVCLLERTLTLLIPGLCSQRYDISFFHLFSCVFCVSSATYLTVCTYNHLMAFCLICLLQVVHLMKGSKEEWW